MELQNVAESTSYVESPPVITTGEHGQPRYAISEHQLQYLVESGFKRPQLADIVGVSLSTVRRRMSEFGITVASQYATLTNAELLTMVRDPTTVRFPNSGNRQMHLFVQAAATHGLPNHVHSNWTNLP